MAKVKRLAVDLERASSRGDGRHRRPPRLSRGSVSTASNLSLLGRLLFSLLSLMASRS